MSEAIEFSFICPACGHDEIVEVRSSRTYITIEPFVEKDDNGFSVQMKEEMTELDEEIIRYICADCEKPLLTEQTDSDHPIRSPTELYKWLKDHDMLGEVLDQ
jgi:hypothetical protein